MEISACTVAEEHIERIAAALPGAARHLTNYTYEEGVLGLCLFYCYYARYTGDDRHYLTAERYLDQALALVDPKHFRKAYKTDSLDCQLSNLGRFLEFARRNEFLDMDTNAYLAGTDEVLYGLMLGKLRAGDVDMSSGALAAGHYFLARLQSTAAVVPCLERLAAGMAETAGTDADGDLFWRFPIMDNHVYLGVSHGSAMVLAFLAALAERDIAPGQCRGIIRPAAAFVLKHQRDQPKGLFPIRLGDKPEPTQFSQCYGDLGVGYGLFRAAGVWPDPALAQRAAAVLDACAGRTRADRLTADAGLYYGAAGVAATFDKLYRLGAGPACHAAADYWYGQITACARPAPGDDDPFGGYRSGVPQASPMWHTSFGWGMIGTGISLMKYVRPNLPPLDGLLLTV